MRTIRHLTLYLLTMTMGPLAHAAPDLAHILADQGTYDLVERDQPVYDESSDSLT